MSYSLDEDDPLAGELYDLYNQIYFNRKFLDKWIEQDIHTQDVLKHGGEAAMVVACMRFTHELIRCVIDNGKTMTFLSEDDRKGTSDG